MTTRQPPVLDRLITREVTRTPPGPAASRFRFNLRTASVSTTPGRWHISGNRVTVAYTDADGRHLPRPGSFPVEASSMVTFETTAYFITVPLVAYTPGRNPFNNGIPAAQIDFSLVSMVDPALLPAIGQDVDLNISLPTGGEPTPVLAMVKVWAARRDFAAGDYVQAGNAGPVTVADSRFIVRAVGPGWAEGDHFVDDDGRARTVLGVAEYQDQGRGRFLELLGRRVGG